jgi:hypothetical protein
MMELISRNYSELIGNKKKESQQIESLKRFCMRIYKIASTCLTEDFSNKIIELCLNNWRKNERLCELLIQMLTETVKVYTYIPKLTEKLSII